MTMKVYRSGIWKVRGEYEQTPKNWKKYCQDLETVRDF